jgi:three-Cys-motif partner protein
MTERMAAADLGSVRAAIVADSVAAWATTVLADRPPAHPALPPRLAFLDLYRGPDRATPEARSVVAAVAARAAQDDRLCNDLLFLLNDPGPEHPDARRALAHDLRPVRALYHPAQVIRRHPWLRIAARLEAYRPLGTLIHLEPWGYHGLASQDLARCLALPQAELLLTLRYPLLNMGLSNPRVAAHLDALWGDERAEALRGVLRGASPQQRERRIVAACVERLRELGAAHVLTFHLAADHRPTELLLHAARDADALGRIKEVLASHSTGHAQGVPDYRYSPVAARYADSLPVTHPLDDLADELARAYVGHTVVVDDLYRRHHLGTSYIRRNYADALNLLVTQGRAVRVGARIRVIG